MNNPEEPKKWFLFSDDPSPIEWSEDALEDKTYVDCNEYGSGLKTYIRCKAYLGDVVFQSTVGNCDCGSDTCYADTLQCTGCGQKWVFIVGTPECKEHPE